MKRDTFAFLAQLVNTLYPILILLFMVPALLMGLVGGGVAGWAAAAKQEVFYRVPMLVQGILFVPVVIVVVIPVGQGLQTQEWVERRFQLLPISEKHLFAGTVLAAFMDPWMLVCAAPFVSAPLGALIGGKPLLALGLAAAGLLYVATLASLSGLASQLTSLALGNRKRAEWLFLVFIVALSTVGMIPMILENTLGKEGGVILGQILFSMNLPGECFRRVLAPTGLWGGAALEGILAVLLNAGVLAMVLVMTWYTHRRLLTSVEVAGGRKGVKSRLFTLPRLSPRAAAVCAAHLLSYWRTVPGKLAVFMGPGMVILFGITFASAQDKLSRKFNPEMVDLANMFLGGMALMFALMSLLNMIVNQFALDGAGFTLQALKPLGGKDLIEGRLWAYRILFLVALVSGLVPGVIIAAPSARAWWLWLSLVPAGLAVLHLIFPLGVLLSLQFPKQVNLTKLGKEAQPHQLGVLLGMMSIGLCTGLCLAPLVIVYLAGGSGWQILLLAVLMCGVAWWLSGRLLNSFSGLLRKKMERLTMVVQGR